jgi:uncharacterized protein YukE
MDCHPLANSPELVGNADALDAYARQLSALAAEIDAQRNELAGVEAAPVWSGAAAEAYRHHAAPLTKTFTALTHRLHGVAQELQNYAPGLREAQGTARQLVGRAHDLIGHISWLEGCVRDDNAAAAATAAAQAAKNDSTGGGYPTMSPHQYQLDRARQDLDEVRHRFRSVIDQADGEARRFANRIAEFTHDSLTNGGILDGIGHWFSHDLKDLINDHAAGLAQLSGVLSKFGTVLSLLSLIPVLAPFTGPAAMFCAGASLAIDVALLYVGKATWTDVGMDVLSMAVGSAGKVTKIGRATATASRLESAAVKEATLASKALAAAESSSRAAVTAGTKAEQALAAANRTVQAIPKGDAARAAERVAAVQDAKAAEAVVRTTKPAAKAANAAIREATTAAKATQAAVAPAAAASSAAAAAMVPVTKTFTLASVTLDGENSLRAALAPSTTGAKPATTSKEAEEKKMAKAFANLRPAVLVGVGA